MTPRATLARLESLRLEFGDDALRIKLAALEALRRAHLPTAGEVRRLHEAACFARAYPGDRRVLNAAVRLLDGFGRRGDLRRHAEALVDSGIAGTAIRYRFFWPMAHWLAERHPDRLVLDWSEGEFDERLAAAWPLLLTTAEAEAVRRAELHPREAVARLRRPGETDAAFVLRRLGALPGGERVKESTHDALDMTYVLRPGPAGPSRTRAALAGAPSVIRAKPPAAGRPDIARALTRPPQRVRALSIADGARVLDLAREAMVTRSRDLDAFAHGDVRDVRLVDDGDGLAFALIGVAPARRLFLPAVYGALTLRNGVPIGYVQIDVLFRNAEMSYNTFDTFRGAEAGFVFGRLLAVTHHLFDVRSFSVEPYQLGHRNEEGLASGAWWFYALCGFRPRSPQIARLARAELRRKERDPRHRSSRKVLETLASAHLHWPARPVGGAHVTPIDRIGFALAAQAGDAEARAARRFGLRSLAGWSGDERLWWTRWATLLAAIPGVERWSARDRAEVLRIVRAKGGRRESEFAARLDAHPRLGAAILAL